MKWEEVRDAFPEQWVLIEVVQAHTNEHSERILEDMDPLKKFSNSPEAMKICRGDSPIQFRKRGICASYKPEKSQYHAEKRNKYQIKVKKINFSF